MGYMPLAKVVKTPGVIFSLYVDPSDTDTSVTQHRYVKQCVFSIDPCEALICEALYLKCM